MTALGNWLRRAALTPRVSSPPSDRRRHARGRAAPRGPGGPRPGRRRARPLPRGRARLPGARTRSREPTSWTAPASPATWRRRACSSIRPSTCAARSSSPRDRRRPPAPGSPATRASSNGFRTASPSRRGCPVPDYVVLVEAHDPSWRATVDGRPAEVLRANVGFRAVATPAGSHRVVFTYRPRAAVVGLAASIATLALCAACPCVRARPTRRRLVRAGRRAVARESLRPRATGSAPSVAPRPAPALTAPPPSVVVAVVFRRLLAGEVLFRRDVHLMWYTQVEAFVRAVSRRRVAAVEPGHRVRPAAVGGREHPGPLSADVAEPPRCGHGRTTPPSWWPICCWPRSARARSAARSGCGPRRRRRPPRCGWPAVRCSPSARCGTSSRGRPGCRGRWPRPFRPADRAAAVGAGLGSGHGRPGAGRISRGGADRRAPARSPTRSSSGRGGRRRRLAPRAVARAGVAAAGRASASPPASGFLRWPPPPSPGVPTFPRRRSGTGRCIRSGSSSSSCPSPPTRCASPGGGVGAVRRARSAAPIPLSRAGHRAPGRGRASGRAPARRGLAAGRVRGVRGRGPRPAPAPPRAADRACSPRCGRCVIRSRPCPPPPSAGRSSAGLGLEAWCDGGSGSRRRWTRCVLVPAVLAAWPRRRVRSRCSDGRTRSARACSSPARRLSFARMLAPARQALAGAALAGWPWPAWSWSRMRSRLPRAAAWPLAAAAVAIWPT